MYHTEEAAMGKKKKTVCAFAEDFQAIVAMIPKLESCIKAHEEIAAGYQKYRKTGGAAISGIEKHVGIKAPKNTLSITPKKSTELKASKDGTPALKTKKKAAV
jgi:hypothetical protein